MKASTAIFFSLLSVSCGVASASEPTDEQLDDWMNYLRSVGIPSTDAWSVANQSSVDRGHALASANPPEGWPSLDAYNESMVEDYETKLANLPALDLLETCVEYVELLEKRTPAGDASQFIQAEAV